jgi:hypothetical protein
VLQEVEKIVLSGIVIIPASSVHAPFPAQTLLRGLSALVPATVQGVVADVAIAAPRGLEGLGRIADHAGCALQEADAVSDAVQAALGCARKDHVLLLGLGHSPAPGFHQELEALRRAGIRRCIMREEPGNFLHRLFPVLSPAVMAMVEREQAARLVAADPELASVGRLAARLRQTRAMSHRAIRLEAS